MLTRKKERKKVVQDSVQKELDNTTYELSDALRVEANNVLDILFVTKIEEEDVALEKIKKEYNFDIIKDAFDEGDVPTQDGSFL